MTKHQKIQGTVLCSMHQKHCALKKACLNAGLRGVEPPKNDAQHQKNGASKLACKALMYKGFLKATKHPLKGDGALPSKGCTAPAHSLKREAHSMGETTRNRRTSNEVTQ